MKKGIALFVVSSIVTLILLEVIIRVFYSEFANYHTEVFRYAAEIKQPLSESELPFHHFAKRRGEYYGVEIETNSYGFRDREYTQEKEEGVRRIAVLGDSIVLGWGVPLESTLAKMLEKKLNTGEERYEVINMGTGNYNSIMQAELFKKKGLDFDPNMVILVHFVNDAEPTPKFSELSYILKKSSCFYAFVSGKYLDFASGFSEGMNLENYYRNLYREDSVSLAENTRALEELINLTAEKNIKFMIVSFPDLRKLEDYPFDYATERVKDFAQKNEVLFLDLLPEFEKYDSQELWVSWEDSHPNAKVHEIAAKLIYEKLIEEGFFEGKDNEGDD